MKKFFLFQLIFLLTSFSNLLAENELLNRALYAGNKYVNLKIISDVNVLQPQALKKPKIAVQFDIEPGWHIYWLNSGDAALPTEINWSAPSGWQIGELNWPAPVEFLEKGGIRTFGYDKQVILFSEVEPPTLEPKENEKVKISADVSWLVCNDICVPGKASLSKEFAFSTTKPIAPSDDYKLFEKYSSLSPKGTFDKITRSHKELKAGDEIRLGFLVEKKQKAKLFPLFAENFTPKQEKIYKLQNGEQLLELAIKTEKTLSTGNYPLSGTIVIDEKNYNWSTEINLGNSSSKNLDYNLLEESISETSIPSYRVVSLEKEKPKTKVTSLPKSNTSLLLALLSAFIAGLILNLMPCVLPIISIKVMGFMNNKEQSRKASISNALAFTLGILVSFLALALTVISLKSLGANFGWGFQFQYPSFVAILAIIVFILALSFFEVYNFSLPYLQSANKAVTKIKSEWLKNFSDGVLATALATPCTAPFLGTALAFAFSQSNFHIIAIFLSIGLGLALPYAYLSTHPKLLALLPKPGNWMVKFKELMGFLLLGTTLWLLFVLNQLSQEGLLYTLVLFLLFYFYFWSKRNFHKLVTFIILISTLAYAYSVWPKITEKRTESKQIQATELIDWKPYSKDLVDTATANKQIVFIDFTADWCITCKANEKLVIETRKVAEAIKANDVLAIKGDWTSGSEEITEALNLYGGTGVPYYVVIDREGEVQVLPTILTPESLVERLSG